MACEGTRFTEKKRIESMKFAKEKNLPELKYHILPRTRGLTMILQGAQGKSKTIMLIQHFNVSSAFFLVPAVYNFMLGFTKDSAAPKFRTLMKGNRCKAELYVK